MEFPYKIIEGKMATRNEFSLTEGVQPTWAIFYLKQGSFVLNINGKNEFINSGDFVIFPDDIKFTRSVIDPITFVYIKFTVNNKCRYTMNIPFGKLSYPSNSRIVDDILSYERLIGHDDRFAVNYREHLFNDIIYQISRESSFLNSRNYSYNYSLSESHDLLIKNAVNYINNNLNKKLKVDTLCRELGTNQSTLNFKFRRELNISVGEFIISAKMHYAKRLLLGTNYSVKEIAMRCGYDNIYYFSAAFKKNIGYTPTEFRNGQ